MPETETPPLLQFDPKGKPTVISYNVPEPTSYPGENIIALQLNEKDFLPAALVKPASDFDNADDNDAVVNPIGKSTTSTR